MTHALPAAVEQTGATSLGDRGASYLRTVTPVVWGTLIAQLLAWATPLLPGNVGAALSDWLSGDAAIALVTAAAIAAWYALWRVVEPHLPDALTRILLGSAASPTYTKVAPATGELAIPNGSISNSELVEDEYVVHDLEALPLPDLPTRASVVSTSTSDNS